jgi:hypothetical protein
VELRGTDYAAIQVREEANEQGECSRHGPFWRAGVLLPSSPGALGTVAAHWRHTEAPLL